MNKSAEQIAVGGQFIQKSVFAVSDIISMETGIVHVLKGFCFGFFIFFLMWEETFRGSPVEVHCSSDCNAVFQLVNWKSLCHHDNTMHL